MESGEKTCWDICKLFQTCGFLSKKKKKLSSVLISLVDLGFLLYERRQFDFILTWRWCSSILHMQERSTLEGEARWAELFEQAADAEESNHIASCSFVSGIMLLSFFPLVLALAFPILLELAPLRESVQLTKQAENWLGNKKTQLTL